MAARSPCAVISTCRAVAVPFVWSVQPMLGGLSDIHVSHDGRDRRIDHFEEGLLKV